MQPNEHENRFPHDPRLRLLPPSLYAELRGDKLDLEILLMSQQYAAGLFVVGVDFLGFHGGSGSVTRGVY